MGSYGSTSNPCAVAAASTNSNVGEMPATDGSCSGSGIGIVCGI